MSELKAIETIYNGFRFRSRLEARWAVFFDALGVTYEYEREGYDLGADGWYLPDFWMPDLKCWIEIKAVYPDYGERRKLAGLCQKSGFEGFLFDRSDFVVPGSSLDSPDGRFTGMWSHRHAPERYDEKWEKESEKDEGDFGSTWAECVCCLEDFMATGKAGLAFVGIEGSNHWEAHVRQRHHESLKETKRYDGSPSIPSLFGCCDHTRRLVDAYAKARQARFEHGESGGRPRQPIRPLDVGDDHPSKWWS